tara:strand:+ start:1266 stop:1403 length:138 start_codon:yes stop_codon:yes gene_type:complete
LVKLRPALWVLVTLVLQPLQLSFPSLWTLVPVRGPVRVYHQLEEE